ncbi:MAG TPA: hypothetical protein VF662_10205 [Allosphingosinicella sp.]|jgi:hypothetical protein
MEIFVPDRQPQEAIELMGRLIEIGIGGRHAAYLATVAPPQEPGSPEMASYLRDFEFMVHASARQSAATLIGFPGFYGASAEAA